MNVTQTMETLSIQTRDDGLFFELRSLISKNFNKTLAGKGKIISFYDESELPQRKYFLKFLKRIYEKDGQKTLDVNSAQNKTIKLNYVQKNTLAPIIFIGVDFIRDQVIFNFEQPQNLFISYLLQSFKNPPNHFNKKTNSLNIKLTSNSDLDMLSSLFARKEHLKFIVEFDYEELKFQNFRQNFKPQESLRFATRFSALAGLLTENFEILNCDKNSTFEEVRENYLSLVKLYHPDRHADKPSEIKESYRLKFEKIQAAYDALKPFFKTQENFIGEN